MLKTFEILHYFAENEPPLHPKDTKPLYNCAFNTYLQASKPEVFFLLPQTFFLPSQRKCFSLEGYFSFQSWKHKFQTLVFKFQTLELKFQSWKRKILLGEKKNSLRGKEKKLLLSFFFRSLIRTFAHRKRHRKSE